MKNRLLGLYPLLTDNGPQSIISIISSPHLSQGWKPVCPGNPALNATTLHQSSLLSFLLTLFSMPVVWLQLFAPIVSMGFNKEELSWIELTLRRQTEHFSEQRTGRKRERGRRNRAISRAGLSVHNGELMLSIQSVAETRIGRSSLWI